MGRDDEAIVEFRKALETLPIMPMPAMTLRSSFSKKGKWTRPLPSFRWIREQYPDDAMASFDLGNAYFQKGQMDEAVASYKKL